MAASLNSVILISFIFDSAILHKTLTQSNSIWLKPFIFMQCDDGSHLEFCHLGFSHFAQKNFAHSFWLNLMMAAILNSAMLDLDNAILDSDTLLSSLRFTQKHSHSTLTLTQTNSFSPHFMMAAILCSAILDSAILHKTLTQTNSIWLKLSHFHSTWWWQLAWILPYCIQPFCTKKLYSFILTQLHNFTLTQLHNGSHLELCHVGFRHCHLGFRHLVIFSQIHSKTLSLHSDSDSISFNLINLMMVALLNSVILNSAILDSSILH